MNSQLNRDTNEIAPDDPAEFDRRVVELLEGRASLAVFERYDMNLITEDPRLLTAFWAAKYPTLAEFLRAGSARRNSFRGYGWGTESKLKEALATFLRHSGERADDTGKMLHPDIAMVVRTRAPEMFVNDLLWRKWRDQVFARSRQNMTLSEAARFLDESWPSSAKHERIGWFLEQSFEARRAAWNLPKMAVRVLVRCAAYLARSDTLPDMGVETDLGRTLEAICREARMDDREIKVLRSRIWCRRDQWMTLAQMGDKLRLSRERVEQIEESAHEKLRSPVLREKFSILLRNRTDAFLDCIRRSGVLASPQPGRHAEDLLPADSLFLIRALHGSVENWLQKCRAGQCESATSPGALAAAPAISTSANQQKTQSQSMDLRNLKPADLNYISELLKRREQLTSELAVLDRALADFRPGAAPAPPRTQAKPDRIPTKRPPRGELNSRIIHELKEVGAGGISVRDLADQLDTQPGNINSWFYQTGRKNPNVYKTSPGRIGWREQPTSQPSESSAQP